MASTILGWIFIVLGILAFLAGLVIFIRSAFATPQAKSTYTYQSADLGELAKLIESLAKLLESFTKLSIPVQWALLGLVMTGVGSYLLATKPF